jgi:AraC-like DNA-binding protein
LSGFVTRSKSVSWLPTRVGVPASQITDILQVRKAFFGALLVHPSVEAAQQMIDSSAMGLKEIADACGFQTPLAMRRTFLRVLGITAGKYASRFKRSQSQTEMHR